MESLFFNLNPQTKDSPPPLTWPSHNAILYLSRPDNKFDQGQSCCAFLGYLLNTPQLRKKFKLKSQDTAELILQLFQLLGVNFIDELDGLFTIFIADLKQNRFYFFQDRHGSPLPLYFTQHHDQIIVSTNLKNLLPARPAKPKFDYQAVRNFIYYQHFIPFNQTLVKGISQLLPGQYLEIKTRPPIRNQPPTLEIKQARFNTPSYPRRQARQKLIPSVQKAISRLVSMANPRSVYLTLSSGFDTNLILFFLRQLSANPITALTIGGQTKNEGPAARKLAQTYADVAHKNLFIQPTALKHLASIVERLEGNVCEPGIFLQYQLAAYLKKHQINQIFLGECADQQVNPLIEQESYYKSWIKKTRLGDWIYQRIKHQPQGQSALRNLLDSIPHSPAPKNFPFQKSFVLRKNGLMLNSFGIQGLYPFLNKKTGFLARSLSPLDLINKNFYKKQVAQTLGPERAALLKKIGGNTDIDYLFKDEENLIDQTLTAPLAQRIFSPAQLKKIQNNPFAYTSLILQLVYLNLFQQIFIDQHS